MPEMREYFDFRLSLTTNVSFDKLKIMINGKKIGIKLIMIALFAVTLFSIWKIETSPFPPNIGTGPTLTPRAIPLKTIPLTPAFDTRTWGQRLRSPASEIPGIKWRTYHNEEYGFEMQYPDDWTYKIKNSTYKEATTSYSAFLIDFSTQSIESNLYAFKLSFAVQKKNIKDYEKNLEQKGKFTPKETIYINGTDWVLTNPDLENILLGLYTARQDHIYNFSEGFLTNGDYKTVIYMIKSFRFTN